MKDGKRPTKPSCRSVVAFPVECVILGDAFAEHPALLYAHLRCVAGKYEYSAAYKGLHRLAPYTAVTGREGYVAVVEAFAHRYIEAYAKRTDKVGVRSPS